MKKITLALFAVICFSGSVHSQLNYNIVAPPNNNSTSSFRAPNGTSAHAFQRSVMYISPSELLPMNLSTITSFSFQYTNGTGSIPVTGNFTVYMQNTTDGDYNKGTNFNTAITGMTTVYNGTYTIPATAGAATVAVNLSPAFSYTGGGLYVAYDWTSTGPFSTGTCTYACNNAKFQMYEGDSPTSAPTTLASSNFRPSLIFGATNTATNEIAVLSVNASGKISKLAGPTQSVSARVVNSSIGAQSNVSVALSVGGANPFTNTVVIPNFPAGSTATVNFAPFTSTVNGINTLSVVSLFADQVLSNNIKVWTQSVTCDMMGSIPPVLNSAFTTTNAYGNGSGTGVIYTTKLTPASNCTLNGVRVFIANFPAYNVGQPFSPVLLDASGNISATGNSITTTSGMLSNWVTMNFTAPQPLSAGTDYFIGGSIITPSFYPFAILGNTYTPYFISPGFYTSPTGGGSFSAPIAIDYLGIEAALSTNLNVSVAATRTLICKGEPANSVTLTASGVSSYTWSTGSSTASIGTGSVIPVTPTVSGTGGGIAIYSVTGTDGASGCKSNLATIQVSIAICTGLMSNTSGGFDIQVFPNPAVGGKSTISGLVGSNTIRVFNALGQLIITKQVSEETTALDLSDQPAGTYLVRITDAGDQTRQVKVIRQN